MTPLKPILTWLGCVLVIGVILGIVFHFAIPPEKPVEESTEKFLDLSGEVMRVYGFEQGEITIVAPQQMTTIDGVHYIYTYDPKYDTDKLYCIKAGAWLYYTIYFMPEGASPPALQKKFFKF